MMTNQCYDYGTVILEFIFKNTILENNFCNTVDEETLFKTKALCYHNFG